MPYLSDMINEVRSNLQGYTLRQDRLTYLANTGGISNSTTDIQVGSSNNLATSSLQALVVAIREHRQQNTHRMLW